MITANKRPLRCTDCGWSTFRVWDDERGGYGTCNRCGGRMQRAPRVAEAKRAEKAKLELRGGPTR